MANHKTCLLEGCSKPVERPRSPYCSTSCAHKAKYLRAKVQKAEQCQKPCAMEGCTNTVSNEDYTFCSRSCAAKHQHSIQRKMKTKSPKPGSKCAPKPQSRKRCEKVGCSRLVPKNRTKYCSDACGDEHRRARRLHPLSGKETFVCSGCNKPFLRPKGIPHDSLCCSCRPLVGETIGYPGYAQRPWEGAKTVYANNTNPQHRRDCHG